MLGNGLLGKDEVKNVAHRNPGNQYFLLFFTMFFFNWLKAKFCHFEPHIMCLLANALSFDKLTFLFRSRVM